MKKLYILFLIVTWCSAQAQYTLIPDEFFEHYLVASGIDSDGEINGQLLTSDIADEIQLSMTNGNQITDLTGIEDFESLETLGIIEMDITEIDLSQNFNLKFLSLSETSLESLDLSANSNLLSLFFEANFNGAIFTSPITNIDISNNILLERLVINQTFITEFDLVNNINLNHFILLNMNELEEVNLKNGFNEEITFLEIFDNPNLQCLQVDDPVSVIAGVDPPYNSWYFENNPLLTITDDCSLGVEDLSLNTQITLYPNPVQNVLYVENNSGYTVNTLKVYDVLGKLVLQEYNPTNQINMSNIASGLLFIHLETDYGVITKKVVKE